MAVNCHPQPFASIPEMCSHWRPFTVIYSHSRHSSLAGAKSNPGRSKLKPRVLIFQHCSVHCAVYSAALHTELIVQYSAEQGLQIQVHLLNCWTIPLTHNPFGWSPQQNHFFCWCLLSLTWVTSHTLVTHLMLLHRTNTGKRKFNNRYYVVYQLGAPSCLSGAPRCPSPKNLEIFGT